MPRIHNLKIADVRPETADAVSVAFTVPDDLRAEYDFAQGQFLTLRTELGGTEVRRSYSICSGVADGELRVAIKRVEGGQFSSFANEALEVGSTLDVMTPDGRFTTQLDPTAARTYVAFAAGSGITPVLAIAKSVLAIEPRSRFTLFYGNRSSAEIMFRGALDDLKDSHPDRFSLLHVLSREPQEVALMNGRLDAEKCRVFLRSMINPAAVDHFFICGPGPMTEEIRSTLAEHGVPADRIHFELFANPGQDTSAKPKRAAKPAKVGEGASVSVIMDGATSELIVARDGPAILDAGLALRPDLPYACKGGVCCTCRAMVLEGEVEMDVNYALDEAEIARGFVLTCQAHPVSDRVVVDYDRR